MKHKPMITIALFELYESLRNKWLLVYGFAFFIFSALLTYMGAADPLRASASLLNLVLLLVPLFSLLFGSISFSESHSFQEILISLPLSRRDIFFGKWIGLGSGLNLSFLAGMTLGSLLQMNKQQQGFTDYLTLLCLGIFLTFVFLSLSFCLVNLIKKKEQLFGSVLLLWFFFFVVYDLLIMGVVSFFGSYPLEYLVLSFVCLNPIDLARVILLLKMDLSAMMGYSGAFFQKFLGGGVGIAIGVFCLLLWTVLPVWLGLILFKKKDL